MRSRFFFVHSPDFYLTFKQSAADYYWFCLLTSDVKKLSASAIYNYVDIVTDLDKNFCTAYRYGALLLYVYKKRFDLAKNILQKGAASASCKANDRFMKMLQFFEQY